MNKDVSAIRRQFPFLKKEAPLAYLDSAATCQKPQAVLDAMRHFAVETNANVNRGVYPLAEHATVAYDNARKTVATFIGAKSHEIIFTKNATEAINLVARSFGDTLKKDDSIVLSIMEHHSNIVPWQQLAARTGVALSWVDVDADGLPDLIALEAMLLKKNVKLVAMTGLSNVLGSLPDLIGITALAHRNGARVLVDGSQLAAHRNIDVAVLDCDFLVFSGHKLYGPTGIGVLYGKTDLLEAMPPFLGGGDMIQTVTKTGFTTAELPRKFEAGTPPATEAVGLAAAIDWMNEIGRVMLRKHADAVLAYAHDKLKTVDGIRMFGPTDPAKRAGCIAFTVDGIHPHDLTDVLGQEHICLRAGHHCTQPLHDFLGINASARLSVAAYNTTEDVDRCIAGIEKARTLFAR